MAKSDFENVSHSSSKDAWDSKNNAKKDSKEESDSHRRLKTRKSKMLIWWIGSAERKIPS